MRAHKWKIVAIVWAVVAGGAAYAWADVAATVNVDYPGFSPLITNSGTPWNTDYRCYGWRFFVTKPMVITHIGVFGAHRNYQSQIVDDGLHTTHQVGIWGIRRASVGGGLALLRGPLSIGPGGTMEDHYVYVALDEPLTMTPDDPTYDRLVIGVWTGANNTDLFYHGSIDAMTLTAEQAGAIDMQNYTYYYVSATHVENSTVFTAPLGATLDTYHYYALNFKYNLLGVTAEAGDPCEIYTSEQALTTITGTATHTVPGTAMQYRWLEGSTVLQDWANVVGGQANLSLAAPVPAFSIGDHTLTLEVKDAATTASDTMILSVANTPPEAQPAPTSQVVEIGMDGIIITGEVADFDGNTLSYQWLKGTEVLDSGTITPPAGGASVGLPDVEIVVDDPRFPLGLHEIQLVVTDGTNPAVSATVTVEVKDTTEPTLAPTPSSALLWPPNHQLVPVTIWANTEDNGGGAISLAASVQSSEPLDAGGDGSTEEDCLVTSIDNAAGTVLVQLRAERSGTGAGRVYTVTITATDASGNASTGIVEVRVPHDKRKK